ncbi:MAG: hypothetical protein JWN62_2586 [Acidimicrobiales bacterium]|nr:hypothetical protein [Acidimicrobiales bacterium]
MHETGLAMLRQRFLREQPQATLGEIEARLRACLIGSVPSVGDIHP